MQRFRLSGFNAAGIVLWVSLTLMGSPLGPQNAMAVEKAEYSVVEKSDNLELRRYDAHIVAETFVEMAAIRYSGTWHRSRYDAHLARLLTWIENRGYRATGEPVWARYDPPFMPWFLRRNEVLIAVEP